MSNGTPSANPASGSDGTRTVLEKTLQGIRDLRDGLIVVTASAYLLGYFSWAHFAWTQELGLIPAIDAQYFLAGIFPTLVVAAFCGFGWLVFLVARWLMRPPTERQKRLGWIFGAGGGILVITGMIGAVTLPTPQSVLATVMIFAGAPFLVAEGFFERGKWHQVYQWLQLVALSIVLVLIAAYLILKYATEWFPNLPYEFGGPSARLVQFDLDTAQLSKPTQTLLLPDGQPVEAAGVQRSRDLFLIFDGGDFVFVTTSASMDRIVKIRKGAINAVFSRGG
jgi:hypothetical protein